MTFSAVGTLEAGTLYRLGGREGELRVADRDIPGVTWVESYDEYDVFEMPDGSRIFIDYLPPKDEP
jgi:hypothetical protein